MSAPEVDLVLVPLDGSDESLQAAEYAVAIADRYGAGVHALYLLSEDVARAIEAGEIDERTVADRTESFMGSVRDLAGDVEVGHSAAFGFSPSRLSVHPGSVVLDAAEERDADFLVVPREPLSGDPEEVLGKAAEYGLMYASQPVLSV